MFETFAAEAAAERQGRCPLQVAGYDVEAIPLFHVLNRPNPSRWRHAIAAGYDLAACAAPPKPLLSSIALLESGLERGLSMSFVQSH